MSFPFSLGILLYDFVQIWNEGRRFDHLEESEGLQEVVSELGFVKIENQGICEDEKLSLLQGRR